MLYVAYGSNLNKEQMMSRCTESSVFGTAVIPNYRLLFRRGVLTIEPANGCEVPVAVWSVTGGDIASLDRYEGYPTLYYKKEFILPCSDGKRHRVFAYLMHPHFKMEGPWGGYLETCLQGYDDFGFDPNVLYDAVDYSVKGGVA